LYLLETFKRFVVRINRNMQIEMKNIMSLQL